jgi:purine operon repressor
VSKFKRNERIGGIVKILSDSPNKVFTLSYFTEKFNAAKSTISEDLVIVKKMMEEMNLGIVETISGAAGGVKYLPFVSKEEKKVFLEGLCQKILKEQREIPGGFLYLSDVLYNPEVVAKVGGIFAQEFGSKYVDYVVTIETKGIPLALMTARSLNVPLVIIRDENKVTEGSTVSMNYVSGSTGKLKTMYLSKRAIKPESRVLIVDDFMKGGGTAKGMTDLVKEFDSEVVGLGFFIDQLSEKEKMISDYVSLLTCENVDGKLVIKPTMEK